MEAVDLGLSVDWSSTYLGASTPEGYGDYYAWGETEPKTEYKWSNYKWAKPTDSDPNIYKLTKYSMYADWGYHGFVDNKKTLDPEDDVAHAKLGGSWRLPTEPEIKELASGCTWETKEVNGVPCLVGTSKQNGKTITLSIAGYFEGNSKVYVNEILGFWVNQVLLDENEGDHSVALVNMSPSNPEPELGKGRRFIGVQVRAVRPK